MKTQLLCTFTTQFNLEQTIMDITKHFEITIIFFILHSVQFGSSRFHAWLHMTKIKFLFGSLKKYSLYNKLSYFNNCANGRDVVVSQSKGKMNQVLHMAQVATKTIIL